MEEIHKSTADSIIVGGDFNSVVFHSKPYQMLEEEMKMINAGKEVLTRNGPNHRFATSGNARNAFSEGDWDPTIIDHILFKR